MISLCRGRFPTIYLVPKDNKPVIFEGDRDQKGFLKFMRGEGRVHLSPWMLTHGGTGLTIPKKTKKKKATKPKEEL